MSGSVGRLGGKFHTLLAFPSPAQAGFGLTYMHYIRPSVYTWFHLRRERDGVDGREYERWEGRLGQREGGDANVEFVCTSWRHGKTKQKYD